MLVDSSTLLILGAGSSASYGFPTGEDFKRLILSDSAQQFYQILKREKYDRNYYLNPSAVAEYFRYLEIFKRVYGTNTFFGFSQNGNTISVSKNKMQDFRRSLREANSVSIDTFISQRNDLLHSLIAKVLVALIIRAFSSYTFDFESNDDWIGYFINRNLDWSDKSDISFPVVVSFNYDNLFFEKVKRNLEHIKGEGATNAMLKNLNIQHVYGNIETDCTDLVRKDEDAFLYLQHYLKENIDRIDFIRRESITSEKVREAVDQAKSIYILGYGFERFNNQILFQNETHFRDKIRDKIKGVTGFGQPDYLKNFFKYSNAHPVPRWASVLDKKSKCRDTLIETMPINFFP